MEGKKEDLLFAEFPPMTKEQWKTQVIADLKGADFDKKLVWKTMEGFDLEPLYAREDIKGLDYLKNYHAAVARPGTATGEIRSWLNIEKVVVDDEVAANKTALKALNEGADGLLFDLKLKDKLELDLLMKDIFPTCCAVFFETNANGALTVQKYIASHKDLPDLMGGISFDPMADFALTGTFDEDIWKTLKATLETASKAPKFFGFAVHSSPFANAGATISQELAYTLCMAVEYLEKLSKEGINVEDVLKNMYFNMAIGTNYFMEIAKLRALRVLIYQIAQAFGAKNFKPGDLFIHSSSSKWTKTIYDPYVNMLRNTTEAMSAIIGGCNSICIMPYDEVYKTPDNQSRRISRNIPNMLKEESYFDKAVDPAAGSYYLETITDKLVQSSWQLFQEIENKGGFTKAFKAGIIQEEIKAIREEKNKRLSSRREVLVGINQYPNAKEKIDPDKLLSHQKPAGNGVVTLEAHNGAEIFEQLRLDTEKYLKKNGENKRPKVFLSKFGTSPSMRTARSMFSGGFLGCAGFSIDESRPELQVKTAVKEALQSKAEIVVLCAADEDYLSHGELYAQHFRKENKNTLLIVAGNPTEIAEKLQAAGVDDFIHMRKDLITTLRSLQEKLKIV
ncbi:MAG: methylmalonyl-CoA mutase family protein [Cyclobacteriaceae bacterium]